MSALPDVVKMKGNVTRRGAKPLPIASKTKRNPPRHSQNKRKCEVAFKTKGNTKRNTMRRGFPLPVVVKMKGNAMRRGEPLSTTFKTKGNTMRRGFPLLIVSKTKRNATRRGFPLPVTVKTKGNATRGEPLLSRSKHKETR